MKFPILDYIRALAVILVTYYHVITFGPHCTSFLGPIANFFNVLAPDQQLRLVAARFVNLGEIGVALFFLVSGFLIMKSRIGKTGRVFIIRRFQRIYPIAIMGVLLSFFSLLLINHFYFDTSLSLNRADWIAIVANSLLVNGLFPLPALDNPVFAASVIMPTYWFLTVIVKYYLLMCLINSLSRKRLLIMALFLMLFTLSYFSFRDQSLLKGSPLLSHLAGDCAFSAHHILYILVGCALYITYSQYISDKENKVRISHNLVLNIASSALICIFFVISYHALRQIPHFPLPQDMLKNYFLVLIIFIFCIVINQYIKKVFKFVKVISDTSFSTYVLHYAFAACFLSVLIHYEFFRGNLFLLYCSVFFLTGVSGWLLYKFIEKPIGSMKIC